MAMHSPMDSNYVRSLAYFDPIISDMCYSLNTLFNISIYIPPFLAIGLLGTTHYKTKNYINELNMIHFLRVPLLYNCRSSVLIVGHPFYQDTIEDTITISRSL